MEQSMDDKEILGEGNAMGPNVQAYGYTPNIYSNSVLAHT